VKRRVVPIAVLIGAGIAVTVGGWAGAAVGVVVAVVLVRGLPRWLSERVTVEQRRAASVLPLAADLMAATLRSGAPPEHAARTVGEAMGGPVGVRLVRVANAMRLGAPAVQAWEHLTDVPGGERLARAATRSADSGAALAAALDRLAGELRAARAAAADAAARRAAVLVMLPLGLCFLPAFLLTGVVPVVISLLSGVLA